MIQYRQFAECELDYQLCYVEGEGPYALHFTSSLDEQWGDDWNDSPWWCNAGTPYVHRKTDIVVVCLYGGYEPNLSDVSVERINRERLPWLMSCDCPSIAAGTTLREFLRIAAERKLQAFVEI